LTDVEDMKISVRSNHNRAKEVKARAEEELARAQLIRLGADRDLVQGMKTIEDLSKKLSTSDQRFTTLWKSFKTIAKLLRTSEEDGRPWGEFIPLIPGRLQSFVKDGVRACVKNVLAHIRVLAPSVPLEKLREDTDDDNYLESIENAESEVEDLTNFIAEKLDIHLPLLMTKLTVRFYSI
jgi:ribosome assembly protein YihI (activator of Der GTPase)